MWPFSKLLNSLKAKPAQECLYVFTERMFHEGASQPILQIGARSFVEAYIPESEFEDLFGGYAARTIGEVKYIGVWSDRMASRMRRVLRERGATFTVVNRSPNESYKVENV